MQGIDNESEGNGGIRDDSDSLREQTKKIEDGDGSQDTPEDRRKLGLESSNDSVKAQLTPTFSVD